MIDITHKDDGEAYQAEYEEQKKVLEDLSYEEAESVINTLQALLGEANEDTPYSYE